MAVDHGNVHIVNNKAAWTAKLEEAKNSDKVIVVDFTATWCGPCRVMAPVFAELSKTYANLMYLKVDVDDVQDVTNEMEVRAMPTFMFIHNGKQIHKIVGANKAELEKKVEQYSKQGVMVA